MRKLEIEVYDFDELSEDAKKKAHKDWLSEGHTHAWFYEASETIKALERELGVSIPDWSYNSYRYDYAISFPSWMESALELKGNRARGWLWSHYGHLILSPASHYWTHHKGKLIKAVAADSRKYVSKCFFDRCYDGTCPLTGVCFDCDALDPLAYFCFGVRWDDKEKRRVPSCRKISVDNDNTVESVLRECVESLFAALKRDCEWEETMEHFAELCECNEWEFTKDGEKW